MLEPWVLPVFKSYIVASGSSGASSVETGTLNARDTVVVLNYNDSIRGFYCDHLHWSAMVHVCPNNISLCSARLSTPIGSHWMQSWTATRYRQQAFVIRRTHANFDTDTQ